MGAIGEAFVAYAQPLLDQTDGSESQMEKALGISQLCYNLSLMPEDSRDGLLAEMKLTLEMDDEEFEDFRRSLVGPMILRHQEMFPQMHMQSPAGFPQSEPSANGPSSGKSPSMAARGEAYPGTGRYAPCPCNSGRKYKFCCGKKRP